MAAVHGADQASRGGLSTIHLAAGQIVCRPGDIDGNLTQIHQLSQQAAAAGARLCLFAEGAITGYVTTASVLAAAPTADGPVAARLKQMSSELKITIAAGTLERVERGIHVSCFIALPDGRLVVQRKHLLNDAEKQCGLVTGPAERTLFEVDGVRMAVCLCADVGIPGIRDQLAAQGCQVLLLATAGGGGREHIYHAEDLQDPPRLASYVKLMDNVCSVTSAIGDCTSRRMAQVAVNLSGDDGVDHYHPGHSSIIDSRGRVVALLPGEYVIDYLQPRMIHGPVVVQPPRRHHRPMTSSRRFPTACCGFPGRRTSTSTAAAMRRRGSRRAGNRCRFARRTPIPTRPASRCCIRRPACTC